MNILFAAIELNIDPETSNIITGIGLFLMGMVLLALLGYFAWHFTPMLIARSRNKHTEKLKAANSIWFDTQESILHCGHNKIPIESKSLEYYVCADTFAALADPQQNQDILEKVDRNKPHRAVEQAVNRLNTKGKTIFGLDEKLFRYDKGSTTVNKIYHSRIVQ